MTGLATAWLALCVWPARQHERDLDVVIMQRSNLGQDRWFGWRHKLFTDVREMVCNTGSGPGEWSGAVEGVPSLASLLGFTVLTLGLTATFEAALASKLTVGVFLAPMIAIGAVLH